MAITTKDLADELEVPLTLVKNFLRERFGDQSRTFSGSAAPVTVEEARAAREAKQTGELRRDRTRTDDVPAKRAEEDPVASNGDISELPSALVGARKMPTCVAAHPVYVHGDVLGALTSGDVAISVRKTFTRRAQELAAFGRATTMKGTTGPNAGWLRVPLGGNGGNHFYLWVLNHGERVAGQDTSELFAAFPPGARFVRAIRHHDETSKRLSVDTSTEYLALPPAELFEPDQKIGLEEPLVSEQREIVADHSRVRVLKGHPGAGKTTSLLGAASGLTGKALYLTWSQFLADQARLWLQTFGPPDLETTVWTFGQFLSNVDPSKPAVIELPLPRAVASLRVGVGRQGRKLGPWWHNGELRAEELYAELNAYYFGHTLPVRFRGRGARAKPGLADADYKALRAEQIGAAADTALLAVAQLDAEERIALFPWPVTAFKRARALQRGTLELNPSVFRFDWVLVDEVQDLTLAEQWLVIDVAARAGASIGKNPGMVIAGDESQTVRPTGFRWGPLANLLQDRLGAVDHARGEHELVANLRSPHDIAVVINGLRRSLYAKVDKRQRPRGRIAESPADATQGRVMLVPYGDGDGLRRVVEMFAAAAGNAAIVYPGAVLTPELERIEEEHELVVWTSERIKGLEFRVVGVLDVAHEITRIGELADNADREALFGELARTAIDRLLVAVSRSTETLVLLSDRWSEVTVRRIEGILGEHEDEHDADDEAHGVFVVQMDELTSLLEMDTSDARERIDRLTAQSEQLAAQGEVAAAKRLGMQAVGLLGAAGRPGAAGKDARERARRVYGQALALDGLARRVRDDLVESGRQFHFAGRKGAADAIRNTTRAVLDPTTEQDTYRALGAVSANLKSLAAAEPMLVEPVVRALRARVDTLGGGEPLPSTPRGRDALIAAMNALADAVPMDRDAFDHARHAVIARVVGALARRPSDVAEYERLRSEVTDVDTLAQLDAEHAEATGDFALAASRWEVMGRRADALRCFREVADLDGAARVAEASRDADAALLRWAADARVLLAKRPGGLLRDNEEDALRALAKIAFPPFDKATRKLGR